MKFRTILAALASCAAFSSAAAADMPAQPFLSTSGTAQLWMQPTIGELKFEAGAQHASAATAAGQLQETSAKVMQLLAQHGIQDADIEAHDVTKKSVPVNGSQEVAYTISRYFIVRVRDLQQWPGLMDGVLALDHVDSVSSSFDRTDSDDINNMLMASAADDARRKGAKLAQAFGRKLGPAIAIARGPLNKLSVPFVEQQAGSESPGSRTVNGRASVPPSLPYSQSVHAIFALK